MYVNCTVKLMHNKYCLGKTTSIDQLRLFNKNNSVKTTNIVQTTDTILKTH